MKRKLFAGALALGLWGGSALAQETEVTTETDDTRVTTTTEPSTQVTAPSDVDVTMRDVETERRLSRVDRSDEYMRGVMVTAGAGFEGYTGALRGPIAVGPAWGAQIALKPSKIVGIELGYSGAANELRDQAFDVSGADLVRNGGQVLATLGLGAAPVQPYLLAGVGINWYNVRADASGFTNDTSGNIPLGGGIRAHIGHFTADARMDWNVLFGNDLAGQVGPGTTFAGFDTNSSGRYTGTLSIGSTF